MQRALSVARNMQRVARNFGFTVHMKLFLVLFHCLNENTLSELPRKQKSQEIHAADIATFVFPFGETHFTEMGELLLQSDTISAVTMERFECRYSAVKSGGDDEDHASFSQ